MNFENRDALDLPEYRTCPFDSADLRHLSLPGENEKPVKPAGRLPHPFSGTAVMEAVPLWPQACTSSGFHPGGAGEVKATRKTGRVPKGLSNEAENQPTVGSKANKCGRNESCPDASSGDRSQKTAFTEAHVNCSNPT